MATTVLALMSLLAWHHVAFQAPDLPPARPAPGDPAAGSVVGEQQKTTTGSAPPLREISEPWEPPTPPASPPLPAPPPLSWRIPPLYGDRGTSELGFGLGYSSNTGLLAAGGIRYFVLDRVAPGLEATFVSGGSDTAAFGMILGALRVVPFRARSFAVVLTGRAGRVLEGNHADGWGAGGSGGIIIFLGPAFGLEIGYEALRLLPGHFCADLPTCTVQGPVLGFRLTL
jgi:hypothetical protein